MIDLDQLIEDATNYLSTNETSKARELFEQGMHLEPNDSIWYYNIAICYAIEDNHERAKYFFSESIKLNPDDSIVSFHLAFSLFKLGEIPESLVLLEKVNLSIPNNYDVLKHLGLGYFKLKKYNLSADYYIEACKLNIVHENIQIGCAEALIFSNRVDEALPYLNIAFANFPNSTLVLTYFAEYYRRKGQPLIGINYLNQITNNEKSRAEKALATCYFDSKDYHSALNYFLKSNTNYPNDADTIGGIVGCYNRLKNESKAKEFLDAYVDTLQQNTVNYYWLQAEYNALIKNHKSTIEWATKAIAIDNTKRDYYNILGNAYFEQKKYEEALEAYLHAHRLEPNDCCVSNNVAHTYFKLKKNKEGFRFSYKSLQDGYCENQDLLVNYLQDLPEYPYIGLQILGRIRNNYAHSFWTNCAQVLFLYNHKIQIWLSYIETTNIKETNPYCYQSLLAITQYYAGNFEEAKMSFEEMITMYEFKNIKNRDRYYYLQTLDALMLDKEEYDSSINLYKYKSEDPTEIYYNIKIQYDLGNTDVLKLIGVTYTNTIYLPILYLLYQTEQTVLVNESIDIFTNKILSAPLFEYWSSIVEKPWNLASSDNDNLINTFNDKVIGIELNECITHFNIECYKRIGKIYDVAKKGFYSVFNFTDKETDTIFFEKRILELDRLKKELENDFTAIANSKNINILNSEIRLESRGVHAMKMLSEEAKKNKEDLLHTLSLYIQEWEFIKKENYANLIYYYYLEGYLDKQDAFCLYFYLLNKLVAYNEVEALKKVQSFYNIFTFLSGLTPNIFNTSFELPEIPDINVSSLEVENEVLHKTEFDIFRERFYQQLGFWENTNYLKYKKAKHLNAK